MSIITRFAPSPTGDLHIGGARTALFNYLFAKKNNGKFLLRIEDTDKKRSTESAIKAIYEGLEWLGVDCDEKAVLQSSNITRHRQVAYQLLENNQAYYCYTSAEELAEMREKAEKKGQIFRFKSEWREKQPSQAINIKPVIRIKAPLDGETIINDLIQGEVRVNNNELDDLVMLRSDDTPTYMLAVVVDDYDMNISHIIRGDDHLTNAFRQKIIYQALNWKVPEFAHIPLIYGNDGTKMSKRHGATAVVDYAKMGYLPQAMRNYLLKLGWAHQNDEIISDNQAIEWFNLEAIGRSPSRFDFAKLNFLNKHYLKGLSNEELFSLILPNFNNQPNELEAKKIIKAINFCKERAETLISLVSIVEPYFDNCEFLINQEDQGKLINNQQLLINLSKLIDAIDDWNHDQIKEYFNKFCQEYGLKIKDFAPILRIVLTGSSSSAGGVFEVCEIIGKSEAQKRINNLL